MSVGNKLSKLSNKYRNVPKGPLVYSNIVFDTEKKFGIRKLLYCELKCSKRNDYACNSFIPKTKTAITM
jgi:hypothetical protein